MNTLAAWFLTLAAKLGAGNLIGLVLAYATSMGKDVAADVVKNVKALILAANISPAEVSMVVLTEQQVFNQKKAQFVVNKVALAKIGEITLIPAKFQPVVSQIARLVVEFTLLVDRVKELK